MIELVKGSTELSENSAANDAANLLRRYSFELDEYTVNQLLSLWLTNYSINWVRLAIVEALYQGRYKAISVEQILALWKRRGEPIYHFNHEFERLVCDKFPRDLISPVGSTQKENGQTASVNPESPPPIPLQATTSKEAEIAQTDAVSILKKQTTQEQTKLGNEAHFLPHSESQSGVEDSQSEKALHSQPDFNGSPTSVMPLNSVERVVKAVEAYQAPDIAQPTSYSESNGAEATIAPQNQPLTNGATPIASNQGSNQSTPPLEVVSIATQNSIESLQTSTNSLNADLPNAELFPCLSLFNQSLKPKLRLHLTTLYQPNWSVSAASKHPIHQFIPIFESSDFYSKLKAVAKPLEEEG